MRVVSLRVPDEEQMARHSKLKWALLVCMLVLTAAITGGLASPDATAQGSNIAWDADGNRAPTARNDRFTATEDRRLTIKAPGVLKNDTDEDGDRLSAARLSAPRHGNLSFNSNGSLVYTPDKNYNGPDSFAYKAKDGETTSKAATVSIVVAAVNDAPGFAKGKDQGVDEDSGAQSVARWARGVKAGPANESGQRLTFKVTGNTRPSLFARGPAVSPGGTLTYTPARDANGEATIRVRLKDSGGTARGGVDTSPEQGFIVTVRPLNDTPVANSDTAEMEENGPPISINLGALVSDVETPDARLVYNVLSGPTAAQGTLTGTGATRTFDSAEDYNGTFNILYTVTDRGDPDNCGAPGPRCDAPRTSARKKVAVTVSNVAPTASAQSVDTAEDTSRTITLAASDPGSDPLSFKIISLPADGKLYDGVDTSATEITSATSASPFTLSSDKVTYAPDAQFNGSDSFDFKANDGTEDGAAATVSIAVTPVNDLPTDITLGNASVDENQAPGTTVGNLSTTDPDSGDTHSYSLVPGTGDDDNPQFQIIGSTLKTDATFDFETKNSYSIRVQSTDGDGETFTKVFTISVTNVNEAPTDITLSSSSVDENQPSGTDVGTLSTTDPDSGETFTYSFVSGSGDDDNAKFQIAGSTLQTDATFDHETKSSYTVRVRTTDSGNATSEKAFTITVNNANDAPTANDDTGTTDEDTTLNVSAPGVLGNDTDQDIGDTRTVSKLNGSTTLTGASAEGATVTINADGSYTYNPGSVFQHLLTGQQDTDTFTYMAKDSGNLESDAATVTITIDGVTDPPTISSGGTLSYTENDPPTPVDSGLGVTHPEGAQISEASVKVTGNYQNGDDVLAFSDNDAGDGIAQSGSFDSGTGELKLSGTAGAAEYQAALRSVTYNNTSESPSTATRTVTFTATDVNSATSAPATRDISVTAVDDPPSAVNDSATVTEDDSATAVPVLANDTDVDGGPKTISAASDPTDGTVVLTGGSPGAHTGLTFQPDANYCNDPPATSLDTFTYTLNGGSQGTVSMTVTCVNDAPVADDETFNGANSAVGNTALIGDDSSDGAPSVNGPKKTISGDILDGDTDVDGPGPLEVVAGTFATDDGGSVTIESDGDFTYVNDPADACADTSDFFDYTVTDKNPGTAGTDTGRVNVSISGCVWYVDNNAAGNAGTSTAPFDTLAQAQSASGSGHSIFVFDGDDTTTGYGAGIDLKANQKLIGEAANLVVGSDTLHTADTTKRPTITDNNDDVVALDDANEVRGVELDPQGTGGGIAGATGDTGGGMIDDVRIIDNGTAGTQPGLELDGTTGTFDVSNLTVSTNGATGVRLNNAGTTNFASTGATSIISSGAKGLDATSTNMGTSTFDDITVTGSGTGGVSMVNTTGTTTFGDGTGTDLSLTTSGTTPAFSLSSAGTISVGSAGTDNVSATGGPAIDVTGTSGATLAFDDVDSTNSASDGINIDGLGTGTFSASSGDIKGAAGISFDLNGGSGNVTYPGGIGDPGAGTNDGNGDAAEITSRTGGSVTLSGSIDDDNDTGGGVRLTGNTGGSTTFSGSSKKLDTGTANALTMGASDGHTLTLSGGGLDIDTTSGKGLEADTSGTLNVAGSGNTINTATGLALNVSNTDIGSSNLSFQSISANGATNGIVLNNTGTSGGLTVAGDGGNCTLATPTCGGGTIQNTTGDGISLTSTRDVSLNNMRIKDTGRHGIGGTTVTNVTLQNSIVESPGNADNEDGIHFATASSNNLSGTASFQNVAVTGMEENGLYISNSSGILNLTVSGSSFSNSVREDGILLETFGTPSLTALVQNSTFSTLESDGFKANANAGTLNVTAQNNTFTGSSVGTISDNAISFVSGGNATMKYTISGNTLNNSHNSAMILQANDTSFMDGRVLNNTITNTTNGNGIDGSLAGDDDSTTRLLIQGNTVSGQRQGAMFFNANNTGDLDVTLLNNTMNSRPADTTAFENLTVSANGTSVVCTNIRDNSVARGGSNAGGLGIDADAFRLDDDDIPTNSTLKLERGISASSDPAQVVRDNNPTSAANGVSISDTITLVNNGTCLLPATTPTPP